MGRKHVNMTRDPVKTDSFIFLVFLCEFQFLDIFVLPLRTCD